MCRQPRKPVCRGLPGHSSRRGAGLAGRGATQWSRRVWSGGQRCRWHGAGLLARSSLAGPPAGGQEPPLGSRPLVRMAERAPADADPAGSLPPRPTRSATLCCVSSHTWLRPAAARRTSGARPGPSPADGTPKAAPRCCPGATSAGPSPQLRGAPCVCVPACPTGLS